MHATGRLEEVLPEKRKTKLTAKQTVFCSLVASGKTQAAAYREAYDVDPNGKKSSAQQAGSRLMRRTHIRARVEALIQSRESKIQAKNLGDREYLTDLLRTWTVGVKEHTCPVTGEVTTTGESATTAQLRAAEMLGRSIGMFKDVVIDEPRRSPQEIEAALIQRLDELMAAQGDPASDVSPVVQAPANDPGKDDVVVDLGV